MLLHNSQSECPKCESTITSDKIIGQTVYCNCGWTAMLEPQFKDKKTTLKTSSLMLIVASFLVVSFIHGVNWDHHFFSIIPLKIKQTIGTASSHDLKEIAAICTERRKYSCAEEAYLQLVKQEPQPTETMAELGELQFRMERYPAAIESYTNYIEAKEDSSDIQKELDANYNLAIAYTRTGQFDQADIYFKKTLEKKPNVIQVTVIQKYVEMLVEANRLEDAKKVITTYRKKSTARESFMEKEYKDIQERLKTNA